MPRAKSLWARVAALLTVSLLVANVVSAPSLAASHTTYYVDCLGGNDDAAGTSETTAWRSVFRASSILLEPGDALLLRRSCAWMGPLTIEGSGTASLPIVVDAYGRGTLPRIQNASIDVWIKGSYIHLSHLMTRADVVETDPECGNRPIAVTNGFRFAPGSSHNILRDSVVTGQLIGIRVDSGSDHNQILNNTLYDNTSRRPEILSDAGAVGITLLGDDNEVAYNDISGGVACTHASYKWDGAAIEIYGGQRNIVRNNRSTNNQTFVELGNERSSDNLFTYNYVVSSLPTSNFLVTRGIGGERGPVFRTVATNNIVRLTGAESEAILCVKGCDGNILSMHRNIIWAEGSIGFSDGQFDEGENVYWRSDGKPVIWFVASATSMMQDPALPPDARLEAP